MLYIIIQNALIVSIIMFRKYLNIRLLFITSPFLAANRSKCSIFVDCKTALIWRVYLFRIIISQFFSKIPSLKICLSLCSIAVGEGCASSGLGVIINSWPWKCCDIKLLLDVPFTNKLKLNLKIRTFP